MATSKKDKLPEVPWTADNCRLTWDLLGQLELELNYKVLFGKKNPGESTSGISKTAVYKRIAQAVIPGYYEKDPKIAWERVKSTTERMIRIYKSHAAKLRQPCGGLRDAEAEDSTQEYLNLYIPADGPSDTTEEKEKNLWYAIVAEWPFFPRFHKILAGCPNVTPIASCTGPNGAKTLHVQSPSSRPDSLRSDIETQRELRTLLRELGKSPQDVCGISLEDVLDLTERQQPADVIRAPSSTPGGKKNTQPEQPVGQPRLPKVSKMAAAVLNNDMETPGATKKASYKRTIEETVLDINHQIMIERNRRARALLNLENRKLLLEELKVGVWSVQEYREKVECLEKDSDSAVTENMLPPREHSLPWDESCFDDHVPFD
ncbi:hypothetical protein NEOLEDRAFT_1176927 [Neolentinus lepideus HHB14362 ss-1]|uniref:Uncharacterized protein n=1 Tax=Neolentinus lepideus HHB14362 ss-1 TaxID=1314782 RepID=A0A165TT57_9AGAM|nr:hypothetical protein NEOLEDRAFT_1176927 [Neolentinus lepideus HHB14362 ss-1]